MICDGRHIHQSERGGSGRGRFVPSAADITNTLLALFFVLREGRPRQRGRPCKLRQPPSSTSEPGRLFDGTGYERNALIVVEGERIRSVDAGDAGDPAGLQPSSTCPTRRSCPA